jgi:hypothetical protein
MTRPSLSLVTVVLLTVLLSQCTNAPIHPGYSGRSNGLE